MSKRPGVKSAKAAAAPPQKSSDSRNVPVLFLAVLGLFITGYLTGLAWWGGAPAFCSEGSSCDVIQQSRWSQVLGLPLSFWGFLIYGLLAFFAVGPLSRLRRWQRLWWVSLVGLAISLYLTAIAAIELGAFCIWCLVSLLILAAIFGVVAVKRPPSAPGSPWGTWLINSCVVALVAAGAMHLYYNLDMFSPRPDPRVEALVEHLDSTDAKFYGASWCVACQQQKRVFGDLAEKLPYVECSPYGRGGMVASACASQGISNYPTWIINGARFEGVLQPAELAKRSGFDWEGSRE